MTDKEKAKAYDEAIKRAQEAANSGVVSQNFVDDIFQLRESENERIRKALVIMMKVPRKEIFEAQGITKEQALAYLEKQKEQKESTNSGKPKEWSEEDENNLELVIDCIYKFYPDPVMKYNLKEWLKSLRPQSKENPKCEDCPNRGNTHQYLKGSKDRNRELALSFMAYLDEHRPKGKMCLSNGECADIEKAFIEHDWDKIMRYANKYQPHWKPSEEQK